MNGMPRYVRLQKQHFDRCLLQARTQYSSPRQGGPINGWTVPVGLRNRNIIEMNGMPRYVGFPRNAHSVVRSRREVKHLGKTLRREDTLFNSETSAGSEESLEEHGEIPEANGLPEGGARRRHFGHSKEMV